MCSPAPLRSIVSRESIPRFRDTRVPTAASSLRSPTILTFNQSSRLKFKISRYLLSNEFSFLEFWTRMIIPFTTGNYEENFYTILFSHDDSNLRARENLFIYIPPSWYFRRITSSRCISAMIYAQFRGKEFRGGKFTRAERVNPFGWKWTTVPPQPLPPEW